MSDRSSELYRARCIVSDILCHFRCEKLLYTLWPIVCSAMVLLFIDFVPQVGEMGFYLFCVHCWVIPIAYNLCLAKDVNIFTMLSTPTFHSLLQETIVMRHYWISCFKTPYVPTRFLHPKQPYLIPTCATRYGKRTLMYYGPHAFNQLPPNYLSFQTYYKLRKTLTHIV